MPRTQKFTYADRVNYYLVANDLDSFNLDDLVEDIVAEMVAHGEVVTRCTRGYIRAYLKSLRIHKLLSRHPSDRELVKLSKKFKKAIDRIRKRDFVEIDYSNMTRISSLLRAAAGKLKSLTAGELRERVIELLDDYDALQADYDNLRKEHEELQVDYGMIREERDELQKEVHDLEADKARLEEHNAQLIAASTTRHATPARESSSANLEGFYTAPSSPQLGQQRSPNGTLSRVPTEVFPPVTPGPPRASTSRHPSCLPTPPTTGRFLHTVSRSDSRARSGSHRSFRGDTPGAASVRGATPGSPSRPPHRHSPPLRQLSSQNENRGPSGSGLAREPSYSEVLAPFWDLDRLVEQQANEHRAYIAQLGQQAVQRHIEHAENVRRLNALEDELRGTQEELTKVCGRLEALEESHRVQTQEYHDLLGRYEELRTRAEKLSGMIKTFTGEATALLDGPSGPAMGPATTWGPA